MKKLILLLLCGVLMMGSAQADELILHDTEGKAVQLSDLKGKWVIINYWADWCRACVEEIPELNNFYKNLKDKNIVFYGVDYDELSLPNLKSSIDSVGIKYPVLTSDPGYALNLDPVEVIPTTFILNPEGRVVKVITGSNSEKSLLKDIKALQESSIPKSGRPST
jgi:peroxiredoxin